MGNDEWTRQTTAGAQRPADLPRLYLHGRHRIARRSALGTEALEWAQSVFLLVLGVLILAHPLIATGSILVVTCRFLQTYGTGVFMIWLGVIGIMALMKSGGPIWSRIRVLCSVVRLLTWLSFVLSMSFLTADVGHISPMMVAYSAYTVSEVAVTYTLARNARSD